MDPLRTLLPLVVAIGGGCAALLPPSADAVPGALVPAGQTPRLTLAARGVQVYECRRVDGAQPAWLFVAPEAALYDAAGQPAGRHGAGPYWQAPDGSRIVGTVVAKVMPRDDAIPWLLLQTRTTDGTGDGSAGRLAGVTSVQRINTRGGTTPAATCDDALLGRTERVPYTADYVFLEEKDKG